MQSQELNNAINLIYAYTGKLNLPRDEHDQIKTAFSLIVQALNKKLSTVDTTKTAMEQVKNDKKK